MSREPVYIPEAFLLPLAMPEPDITPVAWSEARGVYILPEAMILGPPIGGRVITLPPMVRRDRFANGIIGQLLAAMRNRLRSPHVEARA